MRTRSGSETVDAAPASEWDYASIAEISRALQWRRISASELLDHTIHRIDDACFIWADPASTFGLPSTAIPVARSKDGLPIGVQVVGPYLEDRTTIAFAALVAREFGGFVPPPMSSL